MRSYVTEPLVIWLQNSAVDAYLPNSDILCVHCVTIAKSHIIFSLSLSTHYHSESTYFRRRPSTVDSPHKSINIYQINKYDLKACANRSPIRSSGKTVYRLSDDPHSHYHFNANCNSIQCEIAQFSLHWYIFQYSPKWKPKAKENFFGKFG